MQDRPGQSTALDAAPDGASAGHWSDLSERGAAWGIGFVVATYRLLGRTVSQAVLAPVAAYFFLAGGVQRRASADYLRRVWRAGGLVRKPGAWTGYRHFLAFSFAALDKLVAWSGRITASEVDGVNDGLFDSAKKEMRGAVVLTAHLGNPEVIRAVATVSKRFRVNVLVHTLHAEKFNRAIRRMSPDSPVRLVQVTQIGIGEAMMLSDAVSRGEWVVLTADRIAVTDGEASAILTPFLGAEAPFPTGPYVLASALKCPTYTLFCLRRAKRFEVRFELLADPLILPRKDREAALDLHVREFARRLEAAVLSAPLQWFNFYSFWRSPSPETTRERRS